MNRTELNEIRDMLLNALGRIERALNETPIEEAPQSDDYVATSVAEKISGLSRTTLYRLANVGVIEGGRDRNGTGAWRFSRKSLLAAKRIRSEK